MEITLNIKHIQYLNSFLHFSPLSQVKWMMYWIVFAFFTCIETFTDIFVSWIPFYYEIKVALVFWLLSPATKGSSTLYRKFVHPMLTRHEQVGNTQISQTYLYISLLYRFCYFSLFAGDRRVCEPGQGAGLLGSAAAGLQGCQLCHQCPHADSHQGNPIRTSLHQQPPLTHSPTNSHKHTNTHSTRSITFIWPFSIASSVVA